MSKRWLTTSRLGTGRYGITHGMYKRFWDASNRLSDTVVPFPVVRQTGPTEPPTSVYLMTEIDEIIETEEGESVLVELP